MFYHAATNGEEKNAGREREREEGDGKREGEMKQHRQGSKAFGCCIFRFRTWINVD